MCFLPNWDDVVGTKFVLTADAMILTEINIKC